ncbi:hypothetical protein [Zoogloea oleivorans]|nr:hypothetical protein [Zoogloea oleivorans]
MKTLKALKELEAQRAHVQAVVEKSELGIKAIQTEIVDATKRAQEVQASYVRGLVGEIDVMTARDGIEAARKRLEEVRQVIAAARDIQPQIDQEIYAATHAHNAALRSRVEELIEPIKARIADDKKVRASLIEIYGLIANSDMTLCWVNWRDMVADCFPVITGDEAPAAVAAGKKTLLS